MNAPAPKPAAGVLDDLGQTLARLSDRKVVEIAGLFDRGGADPKALKGRAILRDRLRVLRPQRRVTPCRLFCVPFELMLSDDQEPDHPLRQVARAAILPTWQQVESRLPAQLLDRVKAESADATTPLDDELLPTASALWTESSRVIEDDFDAIARHAGDTEWLRHIGGAMQAHAAIIGLRLLLGYGGREPPGEELGVQIAGLVRDALQIGERAAYAAAVTASLHFESPGCLVAALLENQLSSAKGGGAVVFRLCGNLVRDVERQAAAMKVHAGSIGPIELIRGLECVADNVSALGTFTEMERNPRLKLLVERARLHARNAAVSRVLPHLRATFDSNLEIVLAGKGGEDAIAAARSVEDVLTSLRLAACGAEALGVSAEVNAARAKALQTVKAKANVIRNGESADERNRRVTVLARYVELLEGSEAAHACLTGWMSGRAAP